MKKILTVLCLTIISAFLLVGCGQGKSESVTEINTNAKNDNQIILVVNGHELTATLADNSSAEALRNRLKNGALTLSMRDYGNMEKVGDLGDALPTNDDQITTESGDLMLHKGREIVLYYKPNTWRLTRLGKLNGVSGSELQQILGEGPVQITFQLKES